MRDLFLWHCSHSYAVFVDTYYYLLMLGSFLVEEEQPPRNSFVLFSFFYVLQVHAEL